MSEVLTKDIVNCETGEKYTVLLTAEEILEIEKNAAVFAAEKAALETKEKAKATAQAKLAALGLTAEEIAALS